VLETRPGGHANPRRDEPTGAIGWMARGGGEAGAIRRCRSKDPQLDRTAVMGGWQAQLLSNSRFFWFGAVGRQPP
jgi:hypothetical protein